MRTDPGSRGDGILASLTAGLPARIGFGVAAMTVFVVGDSLEYVWITDFLAHDLGTPLAAAAWVVTVMGIVGVIAAYLVAPACAVFGPARVMLAGVLGWVIADALFIAVAIPSREYWLVLACYAMRGIGTPLYAMSFLVMLNEQAAPGRQASAQAWFWVGLSGGQQILGNLLAGALLQRAGPTVTLWAGLGVALTGGLAGYVITRRVKPLPRDREKRPDGLWASLAATTSMAWRNPRVGVGGIVRIINIGTILGMYVIYVPYLVEKIGVARGQAALMFTVCGITGVPGNLFWGWTSDRIGWSTTIKWIACPLNAVCIFLLFYLPQVFGPAIAPIAVVMLVWGMGTSAFVPLSALVPALAPGEETYAFGVLNVAASASAVVGPAVVAASLPWIGYAGVVWLFIALFGVAFFLMSYVRLPRNARTTLDLEASA